MPSYDYDSGGYGRTLAQLMQQRGDREAAMHLQRGDIEAQGWANAGGTIANAIAGWQRNVQENRQRELDAARDARTAETHGIQMDTAKIDLATKQRGERGAATARAVLPLARRENGVVGYDRDLIQREMETAGHADMVPDIFARLDEQEAGHFKVIEARREAIAGDAWRVLQGGDTSPETFGAMLDLWGENDLAPTRELDALRKAAEKEGPERALMAAVESSPRYAEMLQKARQANAPDLASFPAENTVFDRRTGAIFQQGEPKTPANIEAAILQETDPAKRAELIALKEQFARAGRAPAQPVQPPPVQSKSLINDKGELVEGYFDPRARKYFDAQGNVIANPKPASTREQGRQVTSGDAGRIAEFDTSLDDVQVLRGTVAPRDKVTGELIEPGATGTAAKLGASTWNWVTEWTGIGATAKSKQAVIDRVKQVIGKALEGGVLRKEDEAKYEKILPTIGDPVDVVETKLDGLERALKLRRERTIESLTDAGYDTSKFQQRQSSGGGDDLVDMVAPDGGALRVPRSDVGRLKGLGAKVK